MNVVLNIGLGDPPTRRAYLEWPRRLKLALEWVIKQRGASVRFYPAEGGREPILVVSMLWSGSLDLLRHEVMDLAETLEQECIAMAVRYWSEVYKHHRYEGYLVGGGASKWEPFDPDKFIKWEGV